MCLCVDVKFKEAENLSKRVASMGEEATEFLPRAYLALGLSFSLQASEGKVSPRPQSVHMSVNLYGCISGFGDFNLLCDLLTLICFCFSSSATLSADRNELNKKALQALNKYVLVVFIPFYLFVTILVIISNKSINRNKLKQAQYGSLKLDDFRSWCLGVCRT